MRRPRGSGRRLLLGGVVLIAAVAVAALAFGQSDDGADGPAGPVYAFPSPGTPTASPRSEVSFRGVAPDQLGEVRVAGSRSGERQGRVVAHSDGRGASLVFSRPWRAGEKVTVRTSLDVAGARDGDFSFTTTGRPREGLGSGQTNLPPNLREQLFGQRGKAKAGPGTRFRSRPDLRPVEVEITRPARRGLPDGYNLISPKTVFGAKPKPGTDFGPLMVDDEGEPVWFAPITRGKVNDFRVQTYQGKPVLTWWQGRQVLGTGEGEMQIVDQSYRSIKRVRAGNGYSFDFHEAFITERDTMLGLIYSPVAWDLRKVGGPKNGRAIDAVVQEVDIATGRVLFEWHSLQHVPIEQGYGRHPVSRTQPYDYFHVNSVREDTDGNLIISARDTHTIHKIHRGTGKVMWTVGGKRSTFRMPRNARPAWQHDVQRAPDGTLRIFDNQAAPRVRPRSRILWLRLDEKTRRARVARQFEHPDDLSAGTQGNAQDLGDGITFIGWGSQGYFSAIDKDNRLLFDARVARGNDTYRAYRQPWVGKPPTKPAVAAERRGSGTTVWVSWNGATEVAEWEVLAGDSADGLQPARSAPRDGFETAIRIPGRPAFVAVRAKDAQGAELGVSRAERVRSAR